MTKTALIFGSIGAVVETSEIQRQAFNAAFAEHDLDWTWEKDAYREMLKKPGGRARIERYAEERGETVDASAIHDAKVRHFAQMMDDGTAEPRPGVLKLICAARDAGMAIGWATATTPKTVDLILGGLFPTLPRSTFDFIGDATKVENGKPAPDIYLLALDELGVAADAALAVEDTPEAAEAALAASIETIGFPNDMARGRDFPDGVKVVLELSPDMLQEGDVSA